MLRLMSVWAQDDGIVPPIPILPDEPGIRYDSGGSATQVTIEAFLEPLCSDSRQAFPVLTNLSEHYGSELALVVHFYPLAYHRHSHLATQVGLRLRCILVSIFWRRWCRQICPQFKKFGHNRNMISKSNGSPRFPNQVRAHIVNMYSMKALYVALSLHRVCF